MRAVPADESTASTIWYPRFLRAAMPVSLLKTGSLIVAVLMAVWLLRPLPWAAPGMHHPTPWRTPGSGLGVYYEAALDLQHGRSPYSGALAWAATHTPTDPRNVLIEVYAYPPLLAMLLEPLTRIPLSALAVAWELLAIACAVYLAIVLARHIVPRAQGFDRAVVVAVVLDAVLLFGPLRHSMRGAQVDIELMALLAGAWGALRAGRQVTSGLLLGLAIAIKPTYILLLGFYVWRREWRAGSTTLLAGAAGMSVPFLFVSPHALADYLSVNASWNAPGFFMAPRSISAFGVLARIFYLAPYLWHVFTASFVAKALDVLVALGVYVGASRFVAAEGQHRDARWDYAWGMAVLVMLLASPFTEDAHLALTLIPLALLVGPLVARWQRGERTVTTYMPLVLVMLYYMYVTLPVRGAATFSTYHGWRVLLAGYWFYGLAVLTALFAWASHQLPYQFVGPSVLAEAWGRLVALTNQPRQHRV